MRDGRATTVGHSRTVDVLPILGDVEQLGDGLATIIFVGALKREFEFLPRRLLQVHGWPGGSGLCLSMSRLADGGYDVKA